MRAVPRTRLRVLLLALLAMGGWLGLPVADAVLYHTFTSGSERAGAHLEPAGGVCGHADVCTLGGAAPPSAPTPPKPASPRFALGAERRPITPPPAAPRVSYLPSSQQSRAPPAQTA
ncbi:MAG TPA: hypothetical protein VFU46_03400 [Gemmatimonadales bacterium]|nr:hypothetical protein [Gemmatimonadales bacterium]